MTYVYTGEGKRKPPDGKIVPMLFPIGCIICGGKLLDVRYRSSHFSACYRVNDNRNCMR